MVAEAIRGRSPERLYAAEKPPASQESKRETFQKPRKRTAAENTEVFNAVCKWLNAKEIRDAAFLPSAAQSKQAAM